MWTLLWVEVRITSGRKPGTDFASVSLVVVSDVDVTWDPALNNSFAGVFFNNFLYRILFKSKFTHSHILYVESKYRIPEIWANAHETRHSLISYAGCFSLSPVYFSTNSLASQPKIAKNWLKPHIFGVQGRSRSSLLVPLENSSAVLVMIRSKSVSICNHFRARLVDSSRNRTFSRGYPNLMRSYGGLLEPRGSSLRLMPNISYAGCPGLSWMVSAQFSLKMCITA